LIDSGPFIQFQHTGHVGSIGQVRAPTHSKVLSVIDPPPLAFPIDHPPPWFFM
jgi:hypothetical protein